MDDIVHLSFKDLQTGKINAIRFSTTDCLESIPRRWTDATKCHLNSYNFKFKNGEHLPMEGKIADIIPPGDFCLSVIVESAEEVRPISRPSSSDVIFLISRKYGNGGDKEMFVSVPRGAHGVAIKDLRSVVERNLNEKVELRLRIFKDADGVEFEETVDGFISRQGSKYEEEEILHEERVLKDWDPAITAHESYPFVIYCSESEQLSPRAPRAAAEESPRSVSSSVESAAASPPPLAELYVSCLGGGRKEAFTVSVARTGPGVAVRDLRAVVEGRVGCTVDLRQKRAVAASTGAPVVLTQKGYADAAGRRWAHDDPDLGHRENLLLRDDLPPLLLPAPGAGLPVIRAARKG